MWDNYYLILCIVYGEDPQEIERLMDLVLLFDYNYKLWHWWLNSLKEVKKEYENKEKRKI